MGGVLCANPVEKYVSYLMHGTTYDNFKKILDTLYLIPSKGDKEKIINGNSHIFNKGVFMQLVFNCNKNKPITENDCNRPIILVFSNTLLLSRDDYHINNIHCGGIHIKKCVKINSDTIAKTYSKDQYFDFLRDNEDIMCKKPFSKNEIVFTNEVSLDTLKEIWICKIPNVKGFIISKTPLKDNGTLPDTEYTRKEHIYEINDKFITSIKELVASNVSLSKIQVKVIDSVPEPQDTIYCETYGKKQELSLNSLKI